MYAGGISRLRATFALLIVASGADGPLSLARKRQTITHISTRMPTANRESTCETRRLETEWEMLFHALPLCLN
jgi:hypothetical protein